MATSGITFYVRGKVYHGRSGFHVGSRNSGRTGIWGISMFVEDRAGAERIRDAYKAEAAGYINQDEVDAYVNEVFDAEVAAKAARRAA